MSVNPVSEAKYRRRLASDHLTRAERLFSLKDWAGTVSGAQLAVENFAKAVIALFEVPTRGHDPSNQLKALVARIPAGVRSMVEELSLLTREVAPEYGRSSYGEPTAGLTPSDIYGEDQAASILGNARKAGEIAVRILKELGMAELR